MPFQHFIQPDSVDCGPTCLKMIAHYYGKNYSIHKLREYCFVTKEGVSMQGIGRAAEMIGFRTIGVKINFNQLIKEVLLPTIVHWDQKHFIVIYKISTIRNKIIIHVADPAIGLVQYGQVDFLKLWASTNEQGVDIGFALILEPSPNFYTFESEKSNKGNFRFLFKYLGSSKKLIIQLLIGLVLGSFLQLIFPFLTQSLVDRGIGNKDIDFIYLVLLAQLILTFSKVTVEFIRGWILLLIGTRINVSLISDFLIKLMQLPIRFFDTKMAGDLLQRIGDNRRIEDFLTNTSLSVLFSIVNLIIFSIVLLYYNLQIFTLFVLGSVIYGFWVWLFLKKRKDLDFKRFSQMSANQNSLIQLIQGMQEIKLTGSEQKKRWEWERIQAKLFKVSKKSMSLGQYQQSGALLINELKNILITIVAAKSVIQGNLTLGMMLSVQYIIGQMNSPIEQFIGFLNHTQDAKISLERLQEIHNKEDEEVFPENRPPKILIGSSIQVKNLSFQYSGPESEMVLESISINIPSGKQTAIVGTSGSGKTTLIKMLLGFYPPTKGEIIIGDNNINSYSLIAWRAKCGVVMQDGYIFSNTIASNIAPNVDIIDQKKLLSAAKLANIDEFVSILPSSYNTKIGNEGHGLSQGQKQRILIARAVYKDPEYLFFDEATNSLDANNEKEIMENLQKFFKGKTAVIIAHRLSTVKNADQIIVLDKGRVVEIGNHEELRSLKGTYYNLVKNQLDI